MSYTSYRGRQRIQQMVESAIAHCRRDSLWHRMLLGDMAEEDVKRRRHKTGEDTTGDPVSVTVWKGGGRIY